MFSKESLGDRGFAGQLGDRVESLFSVEVDVGEPRGELGGRAAELRAGENRDAGLVE